MVTLTNKDCQARHKQDLQDFIREGVICAYSGAQGMGMCNGDYGGPLVWNGTLIGAVSWGKSCAVGRPDGFTRISYFAPWIFVQMVEI